MNSQDKVGIFTKDEVKVRLATINDIDQIWRIENLSFPIPWSKKSFLEELTINPYAVYLVIEYSGGVIGYGGMWIIQEEAHITNIAIEPNKRGKGFGDLLLKQMLFLAKQEYNVERATLEVRVSNKIAQKLYENHGFSLQGVRPRYYSDNMEDAYIMWVKL